MSADAIKARALAQANGDPYRALEILAQLLEKRDAVVARQQRGIEILEEKIGTVDSVPLWPVDVPDTRARPVGHRSVLARANSKLFPLALEVHVAAVISMMSKAYNTPHRREPLAVRRYSAGTKLGRSWRLGRLVAITLIRRSEYCSGK